MLEPSLYKKFQVVGAGLVKVFVVHFLHDK